MKNLPYSANHHLPYRRILSASLSNGTFFAIQTVVFLVLTPLTLHALGTEVYGLWTIMLAIMGFANLAQFGTDAAIAKYTAQYSVSDDPKDRLSAVVTFSHIFLLLTGVVVSLLVWFLRHWIARNFEVNSSLSALLPTAFGLVALGIIPGFLFSASRGILLGLVHNNLANSLDVGSNIVLWIGALLIGLWGGNLLILVSWIVIVNILRFLLSAYVTFRVTVVLNLRFMMDAQTIREITRFSFLSWLTSLGGTMFQSIDRLLVGVVLGPSAAGIYGIATSLGARLTGLASRVAQVLLPFSSSQEEAGYRKRIVSVLRHSSCLVGCGSVFLSGMLVVWMDDILSMWISSDFAMSYSFIFRLTIVCYGVYSMALPAQQISQGMGLVAMPACVYLGGGVAMNLLIWILSPRYGIIGAVAANYILIVLLAINFYLTKQLGLSASTVFADLGIPLLMFLILASISFASVPLLLKLLSTFALLVITPWLAVSHGRLKMLVVAIKGS